MRGKATQERCERMKTMVELQEIRRKTLRQIGLRKGYPDGVRVVVGMADCGIAAGARPVMLAVMEAVERFAAEHVTVVPSDCAGMCELEPIVQVHTAQAGCVTYVRVTPEMAARIVEEHVVGGKPVVAYTMETAGKA